MNKTNIKNVEALCKLMEKHGLESISFEGVELKRFLPALTSKEMERAISKQFNTGKPSEDAFDPSSSQAESIAAMDAQIMKDLERNGMKVVRNG